MADIIVSGARKEREFQGKSCCYRDSGVIVELLIEKLSVVRAGEVDQSGLFFVH
jgi:hypothetical protein